MSSSLELLFEKQKQINQKLKLIKIQLMHHHGIQDFLSQSFFHWIDSSYEIKR